MPGQTVTHNSSPLPGFYGKFPVRGDFVARNLPMEFIKPWDEWLQSSIAASREQLGATWLQHYLTSPLWRFVLSTGLCGGASWAGVIMPSVDRVGRYFPLTVAALVKESRGLPDLLCSASNWFDRIENLALTALNNDFDLDDFEASLTQLPLPEPLVEPNEALASPNDRHSGTGRSAFQISLDESNDLPPAFARLAGSLLEKYIPSFSLWNTEGSECVEGSLLACEGLPPVDSFSAFLTGEWQAHGWNLARSRVHTFNILQPGTSGTLPRSETDAAELLDSTRLPDDSPETLTWVSHGATDVGRKRKVNEDSLFADDARRLWIVADGMGGHKAGRLASQMVTGSFADMVISENIEDAVSQISIQMKQINRILYTFAAEELAHQVIGSTVVAFTARGTHCGFVWAGDSRIYCCRHGDLVRLTRDHAWSDQDTAAQGSYTDPGAPEHSNRSNVITRAVGAQAALELDHQILEAEDGDTFLLCSDGLIKEVSTFEIGELLASGEPEECVARLMELALRRGARDNVTVLVVRATLG
ncbi:MAG: type VI secretion system-associated protein TagF [Gammaproteobacteria bacterium]